MIIKGGMIAYSIMGDANASIPTTEPIMYRPMWGALGTARNSIAVTFTSKIALEKGQVSGNRQFVAVEDCRNITKQDMMYNDATPDIQINPETYEVRVDGSIVSDGEPASVVSMSRLYNLY